MRFKFALTFLAITLLGCSGGTPIVQMEATGTALANKFKANKVNTVYDGSEIELTLTNLSQSKYSEMSDLRFMSCVALAYVELKGKESISSYNSITISLISESQNGISVEEARERYDMEQMLRIDSLYNLVLTYFQGIYSAKTFTTDSLIRDTSVVTVERLMVFDSLMSPCFENPIRSIEFFGYEQHQTESAEGIWIRVKDDKYTNVFAFVLDSKSGAVQDLGMN